MLLESLLAYAHFVAILSVVVFVTSEAALCRVEWLNAAVVRRLARVDRGQIARSAPVQRQPRQGPVHVGHPRLDVVHGFGGSN